MMRVLAVVVTLASSLCLAHDLSADVGVNLSNKTENNPRTGSAFGSVAGGYDFNDSWSVWGAFNYTRDLPTRTADSASPGGNTFLLSAGAMWVAGDHVSLMGGLSLAPKTSQLSATAMTVPKDALLEIRRLIPTFPESINTVVRSDNASLGANLSGVWASNGDSNFESTVDAAASVTSFNVFQQLQFASPDKAANFRDSCERPLIQRLMGNLCALGTTGVSNRLAQVRLGAGYTATLWQKLDVGLDGAYFLYTADPNEVGYFSLTQLGGDIGSGVPVAPYLFTTRLAFAYRFSKVTLRLAYQLGVYSGGAGTNNLLTLKTTVKISRKVRIMVTVSGQADRDSTGVLGSSGSAVVGALWIF